MLMRGLFCVLASTLAAFNCLASPLPFKDDLLDGDPVSRPETFPTSREVNGGAATKIEDGIMRFGVEIETILRAGPAIHPEIQRVIEKEKEIYERGVYPMSFRLDAYERTLYFILTFMEKEWKNWSPSENERERSDYLRQAYHEMEQYPDLNLHQHKYFKHDLVDKHERRGEMSGWPSNPVAKETYSTWTIVKDTSLTPVKEKSEFAMEIISPILYFGASDYWYHRARFPVELLFNFLTAHLGFEIVQSVSTSTHVHVSPISHGEGHEWTLDRSIRVASTSLFFEPAINTILPKERRNNFHAREYRDRRYTKNAHWGNVEGFGDPQKETPQVTLQVVKNIEAIRTLGNLRLYMNPNDKKPGTTDRKWGWNFSNLGIDPLRPDKSGKGTIEFRRGPQSFTAGDAMTWVELAASIALAACARGDSTTLANYDLSKASLRSFIDDNHPTPEELTKHLSAANQNLLDPERKWGIKPAYQENFVSPQLQKVLGS